MGKTYKDKHSRDRYYDDYNSYDRKSTKKQKKNNKNERSKRKNKYDQLTGKDNEDFDTKFTEQKNWSW
jgi:hypothetical protein